MGIRCVGERWSRTSWKFRQCALDGAHEHKGRLYCKQCYEKISGEAVREQQAQERSVLEESGTL